MQVSYAVLPERVKAAIIDSIVLIVMMYAVSELFGVFETVPDSFRILAFISIFILYDPILTSIYGGTIGHSFSKILVKSAKNPLKNISFPLAIIRFIIKFFLGWLSLLTVTSNEKRKALHDFAVNSIVIREEPEILE
ncbi:RDD family protein [Cellulophaga sp. Hel_I_12]|uniref:RDD family protein n=1 Tax=Cellulophaga sp. Hel_I_12 TaxID=1249972 RepID=UPI000648D0B2|nr:RDD family protein [Cellulophaga sp. Hel_I_12]